MYSQQLQVILLLSCLRIQKKIFRRNVGDHEVEAGVEEETSKSIREDLDHVHDIRRVEEKIVKSILAVIETAKEGGGKEDIGIEAPKVSLTSLRGEKVIMTKVTPKMIGKVKRKKLLRLINQTPSLRELFSQQ